MTVEPKFTRLFPLSNEKWTLLGIPHFLLVFAQGPKCRLEYLAFMFGTMVPESVTSLRSESVEKSQHNILICILM